MSARRDRHDSDDTAGLAARVVRLEGAVEALGFELRTRKLVVVDRAGMPRITAEVVDGVAELRVELGSSPGAAPPAVLVFAAAGGRPGGATFDPAIGVQLWADGDGLVELAASPDGDGRWHPDVHVGSA
jgi:hypothetical protein